MKNIMSGELVAIVAILCVSAILANCLHAHRTITIKAFEAGYCETAVVGQNGTYWVKCPEVSK